MPAASEVLSRPWPLTGRHEDLDDLCAAIEEGCPACFLFGEPGSGKTRLAREVLRRLEAEGWATAGATASDSARSTPLGALAHLVPPGAIESPPTLFSATSAAIGERTGGRPLVVHVDDAHHLDPSSASLLVSLAEAGVVHLVLTVRTGLRLPDALNALRAADGARSLVLGALSSDAIDTLLHRVLGAPLDGVAERQLLETSGGNPLFLRELVLGALADGSLVEVAGVWRLRGTLRASALAERVLGRMSSLSEEARAALELVAISEPIGLDLLETLLDSSVLEDLEERGLIRVEVSQRRHEVGLVHPVYGEILRGSIGRLRLRRLSRQLVDAVEARGARRSDDPIRMVRWQIDAGVDPDPRVVMAGARLARHHMDWTTVVTMARAAYDAGSIDAAALLVEAHYELGEFDEVEAIGADALARADEMSDLELATVHRIHASMLMWGRDRSDDAVAHITAAVGAVSDPTARGIIVFTRGELLAWAGRTAEALELLEPMLDAGDEPVAAQAATIVELVYATAGPTGRAVELSDRWFPVHIGMEDRVGTANPGNHLITKAVALTHAGRLPEAQELVEFVYGVSVGSQSLPGQLWCSLQLGRIAMTRGDAVTARRWFREMVALCRGTGHRRPTMLGLSGLAIAEAHLGDAEASRQAIAEVDARPEAMIEVFLVEQRRGEAWALVASGDPVAARRTLLEGADEAEQRGIPMLAALARFDALRLGDRDQAGPLAAAAAVVDSAMIELAARWAAADDGDELEAVASGFEALGCLMYAAECSAQAAAAWRRGGEQRRAAAAELRADALARQCRGAATPALTTTDAVVPLTAREREIVLLVAEGLTSKDVASRLYLSTRTVSNHLQNAYTKLGISKRSELPDALIRLGEHEGGDR
jgi:DNA-binding CsgD family transcriptional regulator/tetratricopeptide (TPR) repeat protein